MILCSLSLCSLSSLFSFNATSTTEIYTLSLHDALPICCRKFANCLQCERKCLNSDDHDFLAARERVRRSEEHTSELQSRVDLVCRLLLEKKKKKIKKISHTRTRKYYK